MVSKPATVSERVAILENERGHVDKAFEELKVSMSQHEERVTKMIEEALKKFDERFEKLEASAHERDARDRELRTTWKVVVTIATGLGAAFTWAFAQLANLYRG